MRIKLWPQEDAHEHLAVIACRNHGQIQCTISCTLRPRSFVSVKTHEMLKEFRMFHSIPVFPRALKHCFNTLSLCMRLHDVSFCTASLSRRKQTACFTSFRDCLSLHSIKFLSISWHSVRWSITSCHPKTQVPQSGCLS